VKLPAVAITAVFACGIALGLCPPILRLATSQFWLATGFLATASLIVAGIFLVNRARFGVAAVVSGGCWVLLGVLGAWIAERPLPSKHVIRLLEDRRIDLHTPLRWHVTLRDEATKLPWGFGVEIELAGVEYENTDLPPWEGCD
jgi:hypothetical protein